MCDIYEMEYHEVPKQLTSTLDVILPVGPQAIILRRQYQYFGSLAKLGGETSSSLMNIVYSMDTGLISPISQEMFQLPLRLLGAMMRTATVFLTRMRPLFCAAYCKASSWWMQRERSMQQLPKLWLNQGSESECLDIP